MYNFIRTFTPEQKKLSIMAIISYIALWSFLAKNMLTLIIGVALSYIICLSIETYDMLKDNDREKTNLNHKKILEKIKTFWKKHFQTLSKNQFIASIVFSVIWNFYFCNTFIKFINGITFFYLFLAIILLISKKNYKKEKF